MNEIYKKMINIAKNMSTRDFVTFLDIAKNILSEKELKMLETEFSNSKFEMKIANVKKTAKAIDWLYGDHISKITSILQNGELRKRIGNTNILFYGETGTGKTSVVKSIIERNGDFKLIEKSFESLISPKMGQTQLNLMELASKINTEFANKKAVLFIDELDSLINNRSSSNDVAEHGRIVATFIKFMDSLHENIVLFAATNMLDSIDEAVIRRFNIKIQGRTFDVKKFFEYFNEEQKEIVATTYSFNQMIKITNDNEKFKLSDLKEFQKNIEIEKTINDDFDIRTVYIELFRNKLDLSKENWSAREVQILKKRGINVNL